MNANDFELMSFNQCWYASMMRILNNYGDLN